MTSALSTSLPVQLTQLHLDKPGSSTSSPPTMAEGVRSVEMRPFSVAWCQPHWTEGSFVTRPSLIRRFIEFNLNHFLSRLCFCLLLLSLPWGLFNEGVRQWVRRACGLTLRGLRLRRSCSSLGWSGTHFFVSPERFWPLTFIILILPPSHHNEIEKRKSYAWLKCCKGRRVLLVTCAFCSRRETPNALSSSRLDTWLLITSA